MYTDFVYVCNPNLLQFIEGHRRKILEKQIEFSFGSVVRFYHSTRSLGLIVCRQLGAALATGDAIVTLDSHMEVRIGW